MKVALGFKSHSGWAAMVVVGVAGNGFEVGGLANSVAASSAAVDAATNGLVSRDAVDRASGSASTVRS